MHLWDGLPLVNLMRPVWNIVGVCGKRIIVWCSQWKLCLSSWYVIIFYSAFVCPLTPPKKKAARIACVSLWTLFWYWYCHESQFFLMKGAIPNHLKFLSELDLQFPFTIGIVTSDHVLNSCSPSPTGSAADLEPEPVLALAPPHLALSKWYSSKAI